MTAADEIPYLRPARIEWKTIALAIVIYGGWLAITFFWRHLPVGVLVIVGGWLVAWQGSLQHETMHGHPTRKRWLNDTIGYPPLSLWLPYPIYKVSHLSHHRDERLTDPLDDPESFYVTERFWLTAPAWLRWLLRFNQTLLGRVIVGPAFMIGFFLADETARLRRNERGRRRVWGLHALAVAAVLVWVVIVCGMPPWLYFIGFVYAGGALTRIRSFAEHRFAERHEERTAIVEHGGLLGFLYLNNHLHVLHHLKPGIAWYDLPRLYRYHRATLVAHNGGLVYRSYGELFRRFLLTAHDSVLHPNHRVTGESE